MPKFNEQVYIAQQDLKELHNKESSRMLWGVAWTRSLRPGTIVDPGRKERVQATAKERVQATPSRRLMS